MQIENHKEEVPFAHYEEKFRTLDAAEAAQRLPDVSWDGKEFTLRLLGRKFAIAHPDYAIGVPGRPHCYGRHQLMLDLTRADVWDYIVGAVLLQRVGCAGGSGCRCLLPKPSRPAG